MDTLLTHKDTKELADSGYVIHFIRLKDSYWIEYEHITDYIRKKYNLTKIQNVFEYFEIEFKCHVRTIGGIDTGNYELFLLFDSAAEALAFRIKWM